MAPQKKEAVIKAQISKARCELACQKGAQHTTTACATPVTVASFPVKKRRRSSSGDRGGRIVAYSSTLVKRRKSRGIGRSSRRDAKRQPLLYQITTTATALDTRSTTVAFTSTPNKQRSSRGSGHGSRKDATRPPLLLRASASIGRRPLDRRRHCDRWSTGRLTDRRRLLRLRDRRPKLDGR